VNPAPGGEAEIAVGDGVALERTASGAQRVLERNRVSDADRPRVQVRTIERERDLGADRRGYHMRRVLALSDGIALLGVIALLAGIDRLADLLVSGAPVMIAVPLVTVPMAVASWTVLSTVAGMYHVDERRIEHTVATEIGRLVQLSGGWAWGLFILQALLAPGTPSIVPTILLWLLMVPAVLVARALARRYAERRSWYQQRALLLGHPDDASLVCALLERHPEYGIEITRTIEFDELGSPEERAVALAGAVREARADRVILASSYEGLDERTGVLRTLSEHGVKVDLIPSDSEVFRWDAELHFMEGMPVLTLPTTERPRSVRALKRAMDVVISGAALVALTPLFAYCAVRIKLDSPGPVFFRQKRTGFRGEPFELLKFRTMVDGADDHKHLVAELNRRTDGMFKIAEDPRITRFGAKLRRRSLDELPQLINVFKGEMSLVGPRPLIEEESSLVAGRYRARFNVRPGITGPWQVLGRSEIPFQKMVQLDYAYVTNWRLTDDFKLLVRTVSAIIDGRGAY